ncbi:hypothetical protein LSAT2_004425 [Lamellibrachia satsuma]|nr:hypothetical protein LSAT2_004425 [Lamellibrachia satsuma]
MKVQVYVRQEHPGTNGIRSRTYVDNHSSKESVPTKLVSRLCRPTAAFKFNELARDDDFYTKEFRRKSGNFSRRNSSTTLPCLIRIE